MKKKLYLAALWLLLTLTLLLSACGNSGGFAETQSSGAASDNAAFNEYVVAEAELPAMAQAGWSAAASASTSTASGQAIQQPNLKIIYTADISLESTEFDTAVSGIEELVRTCNGYFEQSRLDNYSRYRNAYYIVRVPAGRFDSFCTRVGELCTLRNFQRDEEDISEIYYDAESRLATQRTKLSRLQELLAQAENMEDIITLEGAISETELAIENLTGTLRRYDSLADYSTVNISLSEVYKATETEEPPIGFWARLGSAFRNGTEDFVEGVQELVLSLAEIWVGVLIFALVVVVAILLLRRRRKKRKFDAWDTPSPIVTPAKPQPEPLGPAGTTPERENRPSEDK